MKVSREQAKLHREKIVTTAAKLFRERGFDGIGVSELMQEVGLTHGGFYGHFASKEALMAQTLEYALGESARKWGRIIAAKPTQSASAIAQSYLSLRHRDDPGDGCVLPTLGAEVARRGTPVRRMFTAGFAGLAELLGGSLVARSKAARRKKALAICAALVGAMTLARAVDDPQLSDEILAAAAMAAKTIATAA